MENDQEAPQVYELLGESILPPVMNDKDLKTLENLILSRDFDTSVATLNKTSNLIDDHLHKAFDTFEKKLISVDSANNGLIFVEETDKDIIEKNKYWCTETNTVKRQLTNQEYMHDMLCTLRLQIVKDVINFVDDRLVADRNAFRHVKKRIVKQLSVTRDSSALYRHTVDVSMSNRLAESIREMKNEYNLELLYENRAISYELQTLQSTYETLWLVHQDSIHEIAENDATIAILNTNLENSMNTAASLRSTLAVMKERHEEEVKKLSKEVRRISKVIRQQSFEILPVISTSGGDSDDSDSPSSSIVISNTGKKISAPRVIQCRECETMAAQVKELEGALQESLL